MGLYIGALPVLGQDNFGAASMVVAPESNATRGDYTTDGVADDVQIQAALDALPSTGGTVQLMEGSYYLAQPLRITRDSQTLVGMGIGATFIKLQDNANCNVIEVTGTGVIQATVKRMTIDGNRSNVTNSDGIYIATPWQNGKYDSQHVFEDLRIVNCKNNGVEVGNATDTRVLMFTRVIVTRNDGNGFYLPAPSSTDNLFTDCIADTNKLNGFYIGCLNSTFTACKAFFNGETAGENMGFFFAGYNNKLTNCEAQDNYQSGFYSANNGDVTYGSQGNTLVNCVADSNGQGNNSTYQKGLQLINCKEWCIVGGRYLNGPYGSYKQNYGISIEGTSTKNIVKGVTGSGNNYALYRDVSTGGDNQYDVNNTIFNVKDYGATGDGKRIANITCTSGSKNVTVAGASFTQRDVGKRVVIFDTYNQNFTNSLIDTVTDSTHIVMHDNAALSLTSDGYIIYGTDDSTAIQACLTAAGASLASTLTTTNIDLYPSVGNPLVLMPASLNDGLYIIASQLDVPAGVRVNSNGLLVNVIANTYTPCMVFRQGTEIVQLRIDAMYGSGIVVGYGTNSDGYTQNIKIGSLDIRRVGFGNDGSGNYKSALRFVGHSFFIDNIYVQGGERAIHFDRASDIQAGKLFLVGAKNGIWAERSNQVSITSVFLDTIGDDSDICYGLHMDYNCSDWTAKVQTFTSASASPIPIMTSVVSIGADTSNISVGLNLDISANNSGGSVLSISHVRDSYFKIVAENNVVPLGGQTNPITTCVEFGTDLAGSTGTIKIEAIMSSSITAYTGTISGQYHYVKSGIQYMNGNQVSFIKTGVAKITGGGATQYGIPGTTFNTTSTTTPTVNEVRYVPMRVPHLLTLTDLLLEVTTGPASDANIRVGIYAADSEVQPTGAPLYDSGNISVATAFTGTKSVGSMGLALTPGMYLVALNIDVTMTLRVVNSPTFIVNSTLSANPLIQRMSASQSYGAFPSTPTKWTAVTGSTGGFQNSVVFKWTE